MAGAHHSCPAPSDSTGSSSLPEKGIDTVLQIQGKRSSSVDTSSGSVDTRDSSQKTFWPIWDSVSTLAQVASTLEAFREHPLGCFGTVVSTVETAPRKPSGQSGTVCQH
ncbi:hypothetical protein Taro_055239 [Colocasia esculenta]|uniref:Uncharacterized protein n=1 Tax=Colocasia esculenta TaxID=4460 RepID=A0A843XT14_COLES|nr:hypothetical protein [Colocasia esculenta]